MIDGYGVDTTTQWGDIEDSKFAFDWALISKRDCCQGYESWYEETFSRANLEEDAPLDTSQAHQPFAPCSRGTLEHAWSISNSLNGSDEDSHHAGCSSRFFPAGRSCKSQCNHLAFFYCFRTVASPTALDLRCNHYVYGSNELY